LLSKVPSVLCCFICWLLITWNSKFWHPTLLCSQWWNINLHVLGYIPSVWLFITNEATTCHNLNISHTLAPIEGQARHLCPPMDFWKNKNLKKRRYTKLKSCFVFLRCSSNLNTVDDQ
jgi:hypothetical protein